MCLTACLFFWLPPDWSAFTVYTQIVYMVCILSIFCHYCPLTNVVVQDVGLAFICEALLGHCLAQPRGRDNMTVVLVRFKTPGSCQVRGRNALPRPINQAAAAQAAAERAAAARVPPPPAIRAATSTSAPSTPSFPGAPKTKSPESSKTSKSSELWVRFVRKRWTCLPWFFHVVHLIPHRVWIRFIRTRWTWIRFA